MIENGHNDLKALSDFRNWLMIFRENRKYRASIRRNGAAGLGPITLAGRKIILDRLLLTQLQSNQQLISDEEILKIKELWLQDVGNSKYKESV